MGEDDPRSRSGLLLLIASFSTVIAAAVFVFVPLVECRRCDKEGQFVTTRILNGREVTEFDYCDCASFFEVSKTGKRGRISLLTALRKPRSLVIDYQGTGRGYRP